MQLRKFQQEASDSVFAEWREHRSTAVVCPTGTGKTIIMADIIKRLHPRRALVVAHREELIWQAREKIERTTGLQCVIEMGDLAASETLFARRPVVIATVQTLNSRRGDRKRMGRFDPKDFGALFIDEMHHSTADTYRNVVHYFTQNPELRVVGFTATPDRADEEALGQVFESVAYDYEILDAINDGWLVPIEQRWIHIMGLDFSRVRTTAGDLNGADLAAVMEQEKNLQGVAGASIEIVGQRRAIVFTASVKQAEIICDIFNRHRSGMAGWVCGETPKEDRRTLLKQFASGEIQVIANCGVLTEGFDDPGVEVIVQARPTKSRSLYAQQVGRSTRPLPGLVDGLDSAEARRMAIATSAKPKCEVIDFAGNSGRHRLVNTADILAGKYPEEIVNRAIIRAQKGGEPVNMAEVIEEEAEKLREEIKRQRALDAARKAKLVAQVKFRGQYINPFDVLGIEPVVERGWDQGKTLSEKQRALLMRQGVDPDKVTYSEGRQLIAEFFKRWNSGQHGRITPTEKQVQLLLRYGYDPNVTFAQASKTIDRIAQNGWRKPAEEVA